MEGTVETTEQFLLATTPFEGTLAQLTHNDVVMETIWSRDFDKTNPRKVVESWAR